MKSLHWWLLLFLGTACAGTFSVYALTRQSAPLSPLRYVRGIVANVDPTAGALILRSSPQSVVTAEIIRFTNITTVRRVSYEAQNGVIYREYETPSSVDSIPAGAEAVVSYVAGPKTLNAVNISYSTDAAFHSLF